MPDRYHIHTVLTPGRFHRIGKFGSVDWREDCSRCTNCVKPRCCYDVYGHESAHNRDPFAVLQPLYECKACLSCVQSCTKGLLNLSLNPEFLELGDDYYRPDMILSTWDQAESGKIPVSGAGYRGRFHGPGFDSIWTDMSEIVRPTRDGIHGREYISTSVDVGSKPMRLSFTPEGRMLTQPSRLLELPLPAILDIPAWPVPPVTLAHARSRAAAKLGTVATVLAQEAVSLPPDLMPAVVPIFDQNNLRSLPALSGRIDKMVQLQDCPDLSKMADMIRPGAPEAILSVRMVLRSSTAGRVLELSQQGFKVFHLCASRRGCEQSVDGQHIKDAMREIHGRLVDEGIRDEITLIVSGGIDLAEHMAKAIICGADLVAVDTALLVALGCRVCRNAHGMSTDETPPETRMPGLCPVQSGSCDVEYAARRMSNLMGAWHSQLIEVLGAMGIREVRRLRGEVGRAIFREDMEKEAFGDLARAAMEP